MLSTAHEVEQGKLRKDPGIASGVPEPSVNQVDTSLHGSCTAVAVAAKKCVTIYKLGNTDNLCLAKWAGELQILKIRKNNGL